ncbi:hypothetical protein TBS_22700 [Thermobispora bispora]|jgi:signal peptidase I|uniref:Signal peptidase I n=1 Tax=Thermobispora bispora (strain ATCC 19993 / DSM 43833 / CBS 139.67 / JCM 10125 / KCTC 9307 / NBRC 14880 / R51) TaxID=469371 RepID=D6Y7B2_THEBD|nr:signal peptidase I [Thermobispora bispora]MBO2473045.1 signal peptidase I [Actinomycetales bacterium]MDI9581572.1 signal peptidase I [Thermobispora sp.]ADG87707.1 signal peptidase I [Thermobispora bispora DSM 43833]MBX6166552.1 signal peptidase I [Thermobispora bispora]QSI47614.1 signal peptidase I [Thermobispora bispora]
MTSNGQGAGGRRPGDDGVDVIGEGVQEQAAREEQQEQGRKKRKKEPSFWRELPILIVIALALALLIKTFVVQAFYIPSESMENTLLTNDRVLVNKLVYHVRDIERGDIVVFSGVDSWDPEVEVDEPANPVARAIRWIGITFGLIPGEKDYIKRVIGIPGDRVKCCDAKGRITVNGVPLDEEEYLYPGDEPSKQEFEITVPPGRLWVMGDHRSVSMDSRLHQGDPGGGTIPIDKVIGRAFVIIWPLDRVRVLPIPETFTRPALQAAAGAAPMLLGVAAAVPLAVLRRRMTRR